MSGSTVTCPRIVAPVELKHLTGFVAVAEELHFGRAAERLHIAQSPLSQQIRLLERDLGVRLFDRTTRTVRLTPAGQALVEPARRLLADASAVRRTVRAAHLGEVGRVTVGFAGASSYSRAAAAHPRRHLPAPRDRAGADGTDLHR